MLHQAALIVLLVAAAAIGAFILGFRAWREGTLELDHRIEVTDAPDGMSPRRYRHIIRGQRRRKRRNRTLLWGGLGALLGLVAVFAFALLRRR